MRIYFVLIAVLIFVPKEGDGEILTSPQNEAVVSGDRIKLECASNSTTGLRWQFLPVFQPIIDGCALNPMYNTIYDVELIDAGSCNIVVLEASVNEVGTYTCTFGFDSVAAQLVVLDSKPNCTVLFNGGNTTDLVAGETTTMICTVRYSTNLSPPAAKWTNPQNELVPGLPTGLPMDGNFYSYINITANRSNIQSYSIMIYFLPPNNVSSGAASNAPNYTYNLTSDVIPVLYPPSEPNITETHADFSECEASNLICASDSNPSPFFQWVDLTRGIVTNGLATILAEYGSIFTCTAINTIRGIQYNNSDNYSASSATNNSCRFPYPENINTSNENCVDDELCVDDCPNDIAVLTCYVDTYPPASYVWIIPDGTPIRNQTIRVSENGNYKCQVIYIDGLNLRTNKTIEVNNCSASFIPSTTSNVETTEPPSTPDSVTAVSESTTGNHSGVVPRPNSDDIGLYVGIVIGVYELANIITMTGFLVFYNMSIFSNDDNTNNSNKNKNKDYHNKKKLNTRFPWLEKMLPCMNSSQASMGNRSLWIFLFVLLTVSCGVILFPVLIYLTNGSSCSHDANESQDEMTIGLSESKKEGGRAVENATPATPLSSNQYPPHPLRLNAPTAAHGHGHAATFDPAELELECMKPTANISPPAPGHKKPPPPPAAKPMSPRGSASNPNPNFEPTSDCPGGLEVGGGGGGDVYAELNLVYDPNILIVEKITESSGIYAELNRA